MKKTFYLSIAFFLMLSCTNKKQEKIKTIISGKITNPKGEFLYLTNNQKKFKDSIPVDTIKGTFKAYYDSIPEGEYTLVYREFTNLYIVPGDSLYITFNVEKFDETMHYSGKGAKKNNYLANLILLEEKGPKFKDLFSLDFKNFKFKIDSISKKRKQLLKDLIDSVPGLSKNFIKNQNIEILYSWASQMLNYPEYYNYFTKKDSSFSNSYYSFLDTIKLEDSSLLNNKTYKRFLKNYLDFKKDETLKKDSSYKNKLNGTFVLKYQLAKNNFKDYKIKEYLLFDLLYERIEYNGIDSIIDSLFNDYMKLNKNKKYAEKLQKSYNKWLPLVKGKIAPDFKGTTINGDTVTLSQFKGKLVYVDIWATWCGPCKKEIPFLEKVEEKYKGKNIEFISISIDEDKKAWEKMITEKNMKGHQLLAENAWNSNIVKKYNVHFIPRFILIGKKGEIIDANALRPSNKKLYELIDKNL